MITSGTTPEFSRPLAVATVPPGGRSFRIEARADECEALARRFALLAIGAFSAEGTIQPQQQARRFRLVGRLRAEVVQQCVVTLDPVAASVDVGFERTYGANVADEWGGHPPPGEEVVLTLAADADLAEPLMDGMIDLGEAAAEELALALDPFPRRPDATFPGLTVAGAEEEAASNNPFGVLSALRDDTEGKG
ncbi:MAG: DUF177 domain-containing protein [Rhodospirillales bacterium]|nr:MAG: DUF177 domain-containing protein [Rhodospirillales bacterium]